MQQEGCVIIVYGDVDWKLSPFNMEKAPRILTENWVQELQLLLREDFSSFSYI